MPGSRSSLRPWQRKILLALFKTGRDGRRVYRTCLLMLPRKNGKTELAAAIAIYFLLFDGDARRRDLPAPRPIASRRRWSISVDRRDDAHRSRRSRRRSRSSNRRSGSCIRRAGSFLKAISAEAYSKHGFNAQRRDLRRAARGADARAVGRAGDVAGRAGAAADDGDLDGGLRSRSRFSTSCMRTGSASLADPGARSDVPADDLRGAGGGRLAQDERVWRAANPALGDFRSLEEMRIMAARAAEIPAQENTFRRLYLNQWTEQASRWLSLEAWDACRGRRRRRARGASWYVGIDLVVDDRPDGAGRRVSRSRRRGRSPCGRWRSCRRRGCASGSTRDRLPYDEWARRGQLIVTPGNVVDYERVRAELQAWDRRERRHARDRVRPVERDRPGAAAEGRRTGLRASRCGRGSRR